MPDMKYTVIIVLIFINCTRCELNHFIHKRVSEINNKSREMYGEVRRGYFNKDFELEKLMYPRGNKHKLSALSQAWRDYYTCLAAQLDDVNTDQIIQYNIIIMVFQGGTATFPCTVCHEPGTANQQTWLYTKSAEIRSFELPPDYDRMTIDNGSMKIYNVVPGDEGVFWCKLGDSGAGLVFIEVVDKEPYTVVKPPESRGPHAVAPEIYNGVRLFTKWSPWSECSVCGKVGRRRRYGICYVTLEQDLIASYEVDPVKTAKNCKLVELDDKLIELFQTFPDGLPCRSQYMPQILKDLDVIQQRPSEIMIGLCKVPCDESRRKRNGAKNTTQGRHDNYGTHIYPIRHVVPKQPPLPIRDTIFADFGQRVVLRCPGTTLRDAPVQWRAGGAELLLRHVYTASGGRVYLNSRDHLVFTTVLYSDDNLYSCWQRDNLAGTVKLMVCQSARARCSHRVALLALVALSALALQLLDHALRGLQRRQALLQRV